MSVLADRIRGLSAEVLKNTRSLTLNNVRGSRGVPLRISHPSGANLEFKNGKVYYNGSELLSSNNNPPGTDSTSFTIDMDNEGAGVNTYLCFNRGSTGEDAALMWDEVNDEFRLWKDKDSKTTLATLGCGNIGCQYISLTHLEVNNLIDSINSTIVIGKDLDMNSNDIIHCNSIAAQGMPINIYNGASIFGDVELNNHDLTEVKTISGYGSILYLGTNVVCDYKEIRFGADGSSSYIAEDSSSHDLVLESTETNSKVRFDSDMKIKQGEKFYIGEDTYYLWQTTGGLVQLAYENNYEYQNITVRGGDFGEVYLYSSNSSGAFCQIKLPKDGSISIQAYKSGNKDLDLTGYYINCNSFAIIPLSSNPDINSYLGADNRRWRAGYFKDLYYSGTLSHSDLYFNDMYCIKCGKTFREGEDLVLKVLSTDGLLATVPIHKECAEAPKVKRTIKTKKIVKVEETFNGEHVIRYTTETKKDGDKTVDVYVEREIEL